MRTSSSSYGTPSACRARNVFDAVVALDRWLSVAARLAIALYRRTVSIVLGHHCRFDPSCSRYADEALARYGFVRGSWKALGRLCRCHPWNPGGYDPVPLDPPRASG